MYNITEMKEQIVAPVKDWKWQPKFDLSLSKSEREDFSKFNSSRKIGVQWVHGRGY